LAEQRVADIGASAIFAAIPFCNLRTLNLRDNNITDDCCAALNELLSTEGVCHLEVLVLAKNSISDEGLLTFLPGLEVNSVLHALDLSHNCITMRGMRDLKDCLLDNRGLQGISLVGNYSENDFGCEDFLRSRVLLQISSDIGENKDFFEQYKAYDIKNIDAKPPGERRRE
jgi:Ran GTPase-activating protein (RanGAP) involved in mRNA processing and transport